ncbi:unnamed protein product [Cuscuta europaea]|uniref:Uncharacterized protein n=1 Tax=Cuscuta europaea TaxID=41803 RepID=A0A9P1E3N9_CUSEU|nr:unnamed protein product [Cuscuta europaea]
MQQVSDYGIILNCTPILCDITTAISISKDPVMHSRTKHIHIRHHFLRDCVETGLIKLEYCNTDKQIADIFTKPLGRERQVHKFTKQPTKESRATDDLHETIYMTEDQEKSVCLTEQLKREILIREYQDQSNWTYLQSSRYSFFLFLVL